jgi:hypothetical protein
MSDFEIPGANTGASLPSQAGQGGKFLQTDGLSTSWQSVPGGGDVLKVGTPVNNQIGVWTGDGTLEGDVRLTFDGTVFVARNTQDTASIEIASLEGDRATPTANDEIYQSFRLSDSAGNQDAFVRLVAVGTTITSTSETGEFRMQTVSAGTMATRAVLNATAFRPNTNDNIALGSATIAFSDLFLAAGGVINFDNGDITITEGTNVLTFAGATTNGYQFQDGPLRPVANDGIALGTSTVGFSDLFLAEGAVINWDNGDMTITQASNVMTIAGGNVLNNNFVSSFTTTATAAGTTTLTVDSTRFQFFTGSTTQTVVLPVASTLTTGHTFFIKNNSSGVVTCNSSGANLVATIAPGATLEVTCILASGTTAASWNANILAIFYAGGKTLAINNSLTFAGTDGTTMTFPAVDATVAGIATTQTITNKRIQPRTASSTSSASLTPDLSTANVYYRTTQTVTLAIDAPIGTPVIGETIAIYVDSAGAQTLNINAAFVAFGAAFPATTTAGKTFMLTAQFDGTNWKALWANAV